jgi:dihydrolipoamide dehydrogenase
MPTLFQTDIAVIGAGTAGLAAFHAIRDAGAQTLLIDHGPLGTTCARVGCMPSKAVLHAGQQWSAMARLPSSDATALATARDALWQDARRTRDQLAQGAAERTIQAAGEQLLMGRARFLDAHTLDVDGQQVHARAFVVATGSRPVVPASLQGLGERLLTTDTLFELQTLPASMGVLGMGAIGLEMGLALLRLGVHVTGGDLRETLAGIADPVVAARALELFSPAMTLWLGRPVNAERTCAGVRLRSGEQTTEVDLLLAALGRQPNVAGLELARAGVQLDDKGQPQIDVGTLRAVGRAEVFLAGDVHPDRPLMHEAADEGNIAARSALAFISGKQPQHAMRKTPLAIVFSDPDIASIGTPLDCCDAATTVVGTAQGSGNGRSKVLHAPGNLVRVYVDRASRRLLGASLIATHGEHLAHQLAWAIQRGDTIDALLEMPYYHPSIEEMLQSAFKDASRQLRGAASA